MSVKEKAAAPVSSVGADGKQPLSKSNKESIADLPDKGNLQATNNGGSGAGVSAEKRDKIDRLETVSMTELYDIVYPPKIPIVDGLIYAGTYLFVGAPKVGKSFFMAQLGYHVSMGLDLWDYPVRKGIDKNGVYLSMKKVGKNNPKAEQIEADNRVRTMWNQTVDRALVSGVPEKQILDVKQSEIGQKAKASIQKSGRNPALFKSLIMTAIYALELLISKVFKLALEKADKVTEAFAKSEPEQMKVWAVNEPVMAKSEPIPEMPKKSELVSKYPRLADIYNKLERQNTAIYQREQQLANVEKEIARTKGIFKGKQRKELQEQAEQLQSQIASMKQYLSSIVQGYGYKNVKEFLAEYRASKAEYSNYQSAVARWEQKTGNKAVSDSFRTRLQRKQMEVKERENNRQSHYYRNDRGGR